MRLVNTWHGIGDHSSIQYLSRSFRFQGQCLWTLIFSSSHRFSMGFRSGDCDGHGKTFILRSVNHFCVDFEVCFRSLSCWQVQPRPILSLLEGAVRFSFNICWYLMESMIPCILTRCRGPLEEKQPYNIKDPPPYFTLGMGVSSVWLSFCLRQTHL